MIIKQCLAVRLLRQLPALVAVLLPMAQAGELHQAPPLASGEVRLQGLKENVWGKRNEKP